MSAAQWLNRVWYERPAPPWWLIPLSLLYGALARARRLAYARHLRPVRRLHRPVVVVGNLSVGGTGKTPLVCWLAGRLRELGYRPGIVTRGYGGSVRRSRLVARDADPGEVGDEALLLARRTGMPVAIGRRRPVAAQLLIDEGCDLVLSDDGLQHYALERDCEIIVIDGDRRFGNGWLLPAGPLREGRERLAAADGIVVNGGRALIEGALSMRLEACAAVALRGGRERSLESFAGTCVHAVAGIGHPERFFNMLRSYGIEVEGHALPDHAQIRPADIRFAGGAPVLMTEKDAVKCASMADERHWYVPVEVRFEEHESSALIATVLDRIARAHPAAQRSLNG
jgi:tetraacyldisaccharide 4'-kinase